MFLDFYRLREQPFGVTPDPRFLYMSETHREALASLFYGIKSARGFMALVAKPGMGKTSILFRLMQNLEGSARTVFLFQTQCDSREFLKYLLADMGIQTDSTDLVKIHSLLNDALAENAKTGKQFVVIVDEAQNLDLNVLETIRLLSDFETTRNKLMQIILAGQPQLAEKLASPALMQLSQRISILSRLTPFSATETAAYIEHRLSVAGHSGAALFTPAAASLIAEYSQGIPRSINNLCFNALSWGYAVKKEQVDADIVREVAAELEMIRCTREPEAEPPAELVPARATIAKAAAKAAEPKAIASSVLLSPPVANAGEPSHRWRTAGIAASAAILAFLGGYGWQNMRHASSQQAAPHAVAVPDVVLERGSSATSTSAAPADASLSGRAATGMASGSVVSSRAASGSSRPSQKPNSAPAMTPPASSAAVNPMQTENSPSNAMPVSQAVNPPVSENMRTVVVKPNDTLWGLSAGKDFQEIAQLNKLANPNHIEVGQRLVVPVGTKDAPGAQRQAGKSNPNAGAGPRR
jgi:general secretion pathway protein A